MENEKNQNVENKETEATEAKEASGSFWSKAKDFGKKAAVDISKGAKALSEQTQKSIHEQRVKHYNPLFPKEFKSKNFKIPNIIEIVDSVTRRNIDVCEGAIGWTDIVGEIEVLHLYQEWVGESKLEFIPVAKCDTIYCIDPFDMNKYISAASSFERTISEKIAELEKIANCLGAKSCSIQIEEDNTSITSEKSSFQLKGNKLSNETNFSIGNSQGGKTVSYFEGNDHPVRPALKWFAHDDSINGLIEMRCSGNNSVKSKLLELHCSVSTTMSQKAACAIDILSKAKASASMEKKAIKENNCKLLFEVQF